MCVSRHACVAVCACTRFLMTHWVGFDSQHSQTAVKWVINIQEHLFKVHTRTHGTCITSATARALAFSSLTMLTPPRGSLQRYGNWDSRLCICMNTNECTEIKIKC